MQIVKRDFRLSQLWGEQAPLGYLLLAATVLMLLMLAAPLIWTKEWRWASVVAEMLRRGDYLHPYVRDVQYYDKPLLSYWLMAGLSKLAGQVTAWTLRLPSALAGILAVWCSYRLGTLLVNRRTGLLAGWMLATTYFFLFWARIASEDMLNVAGILLALVWYFTYKQRPTFSNYVGFFLILALTSLAKGVVAIAVVLLVIAPDLLLDKQWRRHLNGSLLLAILPAVILYIVPFYASQHFNAGGYKDNGLQKVFAENFVRYFQPFDHQDPWYIYGFYLPLYLLPWTVLFIPASVDAIRNWRQYTTGQRWCGWATLLVFLFLTLSGSRRNYYVLMAVPFATLLTAQWAASWSQRNALITQLVERILALAIMVYLLLFGLMWPLSNSGGGLPVFARQVHTLAQSYRPWEQWRVISFDAKNKIDFYLASAYTVENFSLSPASPVAPQLATRLVQQYPELVTGYRGIIFVVRQADLKQFEPLLAGKKYQLVLEQPTLGDRLTHADDPERVAALIFP